MSGTMQQAPAKHQITTTIQVGERVRLTTQDNASYVGTVAVDANAVRLDPVAQDFTREPTDGALVFTWSAIASVFVPANPAECEPRLPRVVL